MWRYYPLTEKLNPGHYLYCIYFLLCPSHPSSLVPTLSLVKGHGVVTGSDGDDPLPSGVVLVYPTSTVSQQSCVFARDGEDDSDVVSLVLPSVPDPGVKVGLDSH